MADQSAFSNDTPQTTTAPAPETTNPFANQLEAIKNESGAQKYDTVEKALEALNHSQEFIPQLKTQVEEHEATIAALNEKLAGSAAIEDVVARLSSQQSQPAPVQEPQAPVPGMSKEDVLKVVQGYTATQAAEGLAATNETTVSDALMVKFGEKTQEVVAQKAKELNTTVEALQALSRENPAVVLSLFPGATPTAGVTTTSSITQPQGTRQEGLQPPAKSLMRGASDKDRAEYMRQIKADVYKKFEVTT